MDGIIIPKLIMERIIREGWDLHILQTQTENKQYDCVKWYYIHIIIT